MAADSVIRFEFFHKGRKVKAQKNFHGWEVFIWEPNGTSWPSSFWYKSGLAKADLKKMVINYLNEVC